MFITSKSKWTTNKAFIYLNTAINTAYRIALHTKNKYVNYVKLMRSNLFKASKSFSVKTNI